MNGADPRQRQGGCKMQRRRSATQGNRNDGARPPAFLCEAIGKPQHRGFELAIGNDARALDNGGCIGRAPRPIGEEFGDVADRVVTYHVS